MPKYADAQSIGIYLSMPSGEIQTRPIVEHALRQGKKVFVPFLYEEQVAGNEQLVPVMDMILLHSQQDYDSLQPNKWGIPTLSKASITTRVSCLGSTIGNTCDLDMVLMPGVVFDMERRRLGHGKGYYDFFLRRYQDLRTTRYLTSTVKVHTETTPVIQDSVPGSVQLSSPCAIIPSSTTEDRWPLQPKRGMMPYLGEHADAHEKENTLM